MEGLDYWRLCDEVSVIQAALLIVGKDPAGAQEYVGSWAPEDRPKGYDAAKAALSNAIMGKRLPAQIIWLEDEDSGRSYGPDWSTTTIAVTDLQDWLRSRGIRHGFFFPEAAAGPDYLFRFHANYAPKLAAAVEAWKAISSDPDLRSGKSVKQALVVWLRQHANDFDLTKSDGNPNEQGIEDVAKIANWDTKGGAPRTPSDNPATPLTF